MEPPDTESSIRNPLLRYLFKSWIQTCGEGWTPRQVWVGYVFSILIPAGLLLYAFGTGIGWSPPQMVVAALIAWDLTGGAIGYNHPAMGRRRANEQSRLPIFHHNLQHIHPLILMFFDNEYWLAAVAFYWFATFFLYVEFLEIDPATGRRRLGRKGQIAVVGLECVVALFLVASTFVIPNVPAHLRLFGIAVYAALCVSTAILVVVPSRFRQTMAVIMTVAMIFSNMALVPPAGFAWFVPVYFLKLLVGFTAAPSMPKKEDA